MTPDEWQRSWGADRLIRTDIEALPAGARTFIRSHGLPQRVIFDSNLLLPFEISFSALTHPLERVREGVVGSSNEEWADDLVIGDEDFCNGSAFFCVRGSTGEVHRIDVELENPDQRVSSSVEHFARSLLLLVQWSAAHSDQSAADWKGSLDALGEQLSKLDAPTYEYWGSLIEYAQEGDASQLEDDEDPVLIITTDPTFSKPRF